MVRTVHPWSLTLGANHRTLWKKACVRLVQTGGQGV